MSCPYVVIGMPIVYRLAPCYVVLYIYGLILLPSIICPFNEVTKCKMCIQLSTGRLIALCCSVIGYVVLRGKLYLTDSRQAGDCESVA